jgi:hypothetical protein
MDRKKYYTVIRQKGNRQKGNKKATLLCVTKVTNFNFFSKTEPN